MNDIRRTILWVIFGFSMVLLWDQWQVYNGNKATFFPQPTAKTAPAAGAAATGAAGAAAPAPSASAAGSASVPGAVAAPAMARQRYEARTDVMALTFDSDGGSLVRTVLLKYQDDHGPTPTAPFVLLDDSKDRVYLAQTGLVGAPGLPTHKTPMRLVSSQRELKDGEDALVLRFESAETGGVTLAKTWTFPRGRYEATVVHEIVNVGSVPVAPQLYVQLVRDGNKPPGESSFYSTFTGPAVYSPEKKYQKVEFSDIEKGKADFEKSAPSGYVAMVQHYFASAWVLPDGPRENFMRKLEANLYAVGAIAAPLPALAPGQTAKAEARFYAGPQEEKRLEAMAPGLELVKDYGWFTVFSKPLFWLLDYLYKLLGNWGWAIVALVVLLKVAFYWLNAKAYASMAKMKAINPKVMEMRERLKDDPQKMQQEMMRIYREEKVNPMGGCFPILVQIPVFIALYWVLLSSVEMRGAPWIGWIKDLSAPDPWFILPALMTASSLLQTWLNPTPPDPMQAKMMWIMPLVFGIMFFFFPAGLVLYWLTNNILSIAQQWIINKRLGVA
ncbi:MAG TPA: membrane protein insertase YidC [Burkholderiaceae bacterium]|nr:membrane protein insertase YidC [Burkholderiaceae bacterium]